MGRGRQKAKHTKVARELKYFSPDTNYNALERELTHPVTGAPIDPKLEEDLEKWPEFSTTEHRVPQFNPPEFNGPVFSPVETEPAAAVVLESVELLPIADGSNFGDGEFETEQNKTA